MALKDLKIVEVNDVNLSKLQENVRLFLEQLDYNLLSGNLTEDIVISTTTTLVPHKLDRKFMGFIITDQNADARIWRDTTSQADKTKFIPLIASSTVTIKMWVF